MAPERLTGSIKLFGASLKDYVSDEGAGQSDISLYGNVVDMTTSAVTTIGGADINLQANRLNMNRLSGLHAISPEAGEGGNININADDLFIDRRSGSAPLHMVEMAGTLTLMVGK